MWFICSNCGITFERDWHQIRRHYFCCVDCCNLFKSSGYVKTGYPAGRRPRNFSAVDEYSRITSKMSCCTILKKHRVLLKSDPERLSTDFIKKLSRCDCDDIV